MQKQLSKGELQQYNKIRENQLNPAEEGIASLCLEYYLNYKEQVNNVPIDKVSLAFRCALFMAEKSQFSINMKGEKVRAISFSLNQLVKDYKLDDTMFMLKQMTKKIKTIDESTSAYLNNIVKQISFLITLYSKFEKTFSQKLQLVLSHKLSSKETNNEDGGAYVKTFTSFAWLLFIITKNQVLKRSLELLPNTCMVAHIISMMLIFSWEYVKPLALMRADSKLHKDCTQRQVKKIIKQKILQIFCIKDVAQYQGVAKQFQQYFANIFNSKFFRMNEQKLDFLSLQNINYNYKKLDKFYETNLSLQYLDQRIFFKQRTMNLTPSKFTPFARQGYVNKFQKQPLGNKLSTVPQKPTKQQAFNSHRILNYEAIQKEIQIKSTTPIHDIKLPKNIIQSPSMVKVPLVMATPVSTGMQMYNYINEKKKKIRDFHSQVRSLDRSIFSLIDQVFAAQGNQDGKEFKQNKDNKNKSQMIAALYKIFSQDYLSQNSFQKDTSELMKAFLGLSMQLVFFVSNMTLTFQRIQQILQLQPFQMWKAIDYYLKSDKSIPYPIKLHFLDLQVNFISFKLWKNMDMVNKISAFGNKSTRQIPQSQIPIEKLFKRIVHQVAFQIKRLTQLLQIDEQTSQKIFDLMKEILTSWPELLYHRHLDQLIICSIYAFCKSIYKIMFNDIKEVYTGSNPHLRPDLMENIIVQVYMGDGQETKDVIAFYNSVFLKLLKEFIVFTINKGNNTGTTNNTNNNPNNNLVNKNNKKNTLLMSPLKAIIPKQINFKSKNMPGNTNNLNGKTKNGNMTPQTQLLFAYNQSPLLKYETNAFKGPLKSKKVLTYEQQEDKVKNKSYQQQFGAPNPRNNENTGVASPHTLSTNNYQSTNDYINKKYARKATTPTGQQTQVHPPTHTHTISTHTVSHGVNSHNGHQQQGSYNHGHHMPSQMPLQNIAKENQNPPIMLGGASNSHRVLFDDGNTNAGKKDNNYGLQDKYKGKNYQFGAFRRQ